MNNNQKIIKLCPQEERGLRVPANAGRDISAACDGFFKSRNINYENGWFHKRNKRKKELQKLKDEQNKDN